MVLPIIKRVGSGQPFFVLERRGFLHFLLAEKGQKSYLCIPYENGI